VTIRRGRASPAARLAVPALCVLWLIPAAGILITSLRTMDAVNSSGWWTVFRLPLDLSQFSFASYRQALYGGMASSFLNSLTVTSRPSPSRSWSPARPPTPSPSCSSRAATCCSR
jgi:alpha-glucoside transport system permease protein